MSVPLAHSRNDRGDADPLANHLADTAQYAAEFAARFGSASFARCAGLWHDLGKNALDFQEYLARSGDARLGGSPAGKVDHSSAGAVHALDTLGVGLGLPLAFVIAGHHAGLADRADLESRLGQRRVRLVAALANPDRVVPVAGVPAPPAFLRAAGVGGEDLKRRYEFWVRMLFSCLVDADFLATERHFAGGETAPRGGHPPLSELKKKYDDYMGALGAAAEATPVNAVRRRVLAACREKGRSCPPGVFTLTGPTGCGKTLAAVGFALEHACRAGSGGQPRCERVIVVLPLTSAIDQNAGVYRDVFGQDQVLEHHASIDTDDPARENARSRVARENWDAPVVVTTSVQFLESLLANRPARCRKLHRVARSVVIFDEVQALPIPHLIPILDVLKELVRAYGVTLVLSTATQPALKHRQSGLGQVFPGFKDPVEIVDDVGPVFESLKRVEVTWPADLRRALPWGRLAGEVRDEKEDALVIVHRRKDARVLAGLIPGSVHLSALMCAKHRLQVIEAVKGRLRVNRERRDRREPAGPLRVVSTQLVEAGVDLDFPVVYRALGGFDAVAQAAGRCNREGRLVGRCGRVRVFVPPSDPPKGTPRDGQAVARAMLAERPELDPLCPGVFDEYFRRLYFGRHFDEQGIQALRAATRFKAVARAFAVVEDGWSSPVVVPYDDTAKGLLTALAEAGPEGVSRGILRRLQPYTVTVPRRVAQSARAQRVFIPSLLGTVDAVAPGFSHLYDERFGLKLEGPLRCDAESPVR